MNPKLFQFPQVYVVEASAGSGKTYALARRYLQLLLDPRLKSEESPLNSILAITFTNKAALEMKERILELLKKLALDKFASSEEKNELLACLGIDAGLAQEKAFSAMEYILKNYNFFQVQTIDSFINTILSGCAFKLDLSANFTTEREYRQYLALSLDRLIERAQQDKPTLKLFHNFLKQYLYLENSAGWFPKQEILGVINELYSLANRYNGDFKRSPVEYDDLSALKQEALGLMRKLQEILPRGTHKSFADALAAFLAKNKESFALDALSAYFKRPELPLNKEHASSTEAQKLWERLKEKLAFLAQGESLFIYNYYLDIYHAAFLDLKALASRDDILFLEALNKEAADLFQEKNLGLPELYWRLATRFRHFLLDEFQDTSLLQWENIYPMVEEALAVSGSLFYVGDRKQAIYRFRGGEAALIDQVKQGMGEANLIEQALSKNFRSQRRIVEFNNRIFSPANLARFLDALEEAQKEDLFPVEDRQEILNVFNTAQQEYRQDKSGGYVQLFPLEASDSRQREGLIREKLLLLVQELKARFAWEDIAILVRRNEQAQRVSAWLLEAGLPVESETTLDLRQNSRIKELISFLRFLNSPIDDLAFASFILGDIFCRAAKIESESVQDFLFDLSQDKQNKTYLYRNFRQHFPQLWDGLLDGFFKSVGFVPLYELVISILAKFRCLEEFPQEQAFFMGFLELIRKQEKDYPGILAFLEFLEQAQPEELYVNSSSSRAVKVLTIHKAKGLEFPAVVIPFPELELKPAPRIAFAQGDGLTLAHNKKSYADFSPFIAKLRGQERRKNLVDELNTLYVALTRPLEELYLFLPQGAKRGANIVAQLFPEPDYSGGAKTKFINSAAKKATLVEIQPAQYQDWVHLLKDEFVEEEILRRRSQVQRGDILHYILSFIGNLHQKDKASALKRALGFAAAKFPLAQGSGEYQQVVSALLEKKELRRFLEVPEGEVFTEKEFVNRFGDTKRIDRLIITASEAVIIDYKSERLAQSDYPQQLREYISIVQEIYPKLKVRGILLYLDDLSIEEVS